MKKSMAAQVVPATKNKNKESSAKDQWVKYEMASSSAISVSSWNACLMSNNEASSRTCLASPLWVKMSLEIDGDERG